MQLVSSSLKAPKRYGEDSLIVWSFRYLYEREIYITAQKMVRQAISAFEDTTTLEYASALISAASST